MITRRNMLLGAAAMLPGCTLLDGLTRDSAMRAVLLSQPFDMLKPDNYDLWKEIEITFDPRFMMGG